MRVLTYLELSRYNEWELGQLLRDLLLALRTLRPDSRAHRAAELNVHHVRLFLARHRRMRMRPRPF